MEFADLYHTHISSFDTNDYAEACARFNRITKARLGEKVRVSKDEYQESSKDIVHEYRLYLFAEAGFDIAFRNFLDRWGYNGLLVDYNPLVATFNNLLLLKQLLKLPILKCCRAQALQVAENSGKMEARDIICRALMADITSDANIEDLCKILLSGSKVSVS